MAAKSRPLLVRVVPWLAFALLVGRGPAWAQPAGAPAAPSRLELQRGDRVILIGNTLAERQQHFNHFEAALLALYPALDLSVRNLGWSADTLTLQPRPLNFGDAATHLAAQQPDVMIAFFGLNESFAGEAGVADFERDLDTYVTTHLAAKYNGTAPPRLALVSPIAHERLPHLVHVDVEGRNRELARYTEVMRRVAARRRVPFADVYTPTRQAMAAAKQPLTINGIHLNEVGDRVFAGVLVAALGLGPAASVPASKAFAELRELVHEKNRLFFYRFRPLNAEYVVGRRVEPFGSVNFPPEMKALDGMIADREKKIWKQARAVARIPAPSSPPSAARGPA